MLAEPMTYNANLQYHIHLRRPHAQQQAFIDSPAQRKIIRAGRRSGKTTGIAILAVQAFLAQRRVLYATPTQEQVDKFWHEIKQALVEPLDARVFYKNETLHLIERAGTDARIRAKTAWNADTLRGDYADLLIMDEFQLMDEEAWELVGAPMLLDNNGAAVFIYTPPSLASRFASKARDPMHAARWYKRAALDMSGRWAAFHFSSHDNPYISGEALADITLDMTALAYRQEIMAEDVDEVPGALWTRSTLERTRRTEAPELVRIVVGVDPPGGTTECGVVAAGKGRDGHGYIIRDDSLQASPDVWARAVLTCAERTQANVVVGEKNFGGDMVGHTLQTAAQALGQALSYKDVSASRGKAVRAEPVAALFEQGRAHIVGSLPRLEDEMCLWLPGSTGNSPNRMDAMVWAATELMLGAEAKIWV